MDAVNAAVSTDTLVGESEIGAGAIGEEGVVGIGVGGAGIGGADKGAGGGGDGGGVEGIGGGAIGDGAGAVVASCAEVDVNVVFGVGDVRERDGGLRDGAAGVEVAGNPRGREDPGLVGQGDLLDDRPARASRLLCGGSVDARRERSTVAELVRRFVEPD